MLWGLLRQPLLTESKRDCFQFIRGGQVWQHGFGCIYILYNTMPHEQIALAGLQLHLAYALASMDHSRISLRPFKPSDADDFLKWAGDDRVTRYLRWNSVRSKEEALAYIQKVAMPHPWRQSVCLDDRSVGYVSFKPESGDYRCKAHVSYAVGAEHWGQGIVAEALRIAIPAVFKQFPQLLRLEALVEVENIGSQRVLQKVGFVKEGVLRKYGYCKGELKDFVIYSFLDTDKLM